MFRCLAIAAALLACAATARPATAQEAYCGGALVAQRFITQVAPGPSGRATYSVELRNTGGEVREFRLVVTGSMMGRPASGMVQSIAGGATATFPLGFSPNMAGAAPLRGDQLAIATRIGCL